MINASYARNAYTQSNLNTNTTTPLALVIMLYGGAIESLERAINAIQAKQVQTKVKAMEKAIAIINELIDSLDHEKGGEIALNLEGLYMYMMKELVLANIKNDAQQIQHILNLLKTIQEGWLDIKEKNPGF